METNEMTPGDWLANTNASLDEATNNIPNYQAQQPQKSNQTYDAIAQQNELLMRKVFELEEKVTNQNNKFAEIDNVKRNLNEYGQKIDRVSKDANYVSNENAKKEILEDWRKVEEDKVFGSPALREMGISIEEGKKIAMDYAQKYGVYLQPLQAIAIANSEKLMTQLNKYAEQDYNYKNLRGFKTENLPKSIHEYNPKTNPRDVALAALTEMGM